MTRSHRLTTICLSLFCLIIGLSIILNSLHSAPPTREERSKKVSEAEERGLPKTAVEHLTLIIDGAVKDKAYPEAIKAIAKKIALESGTEEEADSAEKITRMQAAIATSPVEMHPVMNAILAHWWWNYF